MSSCTACGHQLGVGRFCTNCGSPVDSSTPDGTPVSTPVTDGDWRTDTAERKLGPPLVPSDPRTPPAATAPPPPPRYPLFADEVDGWTPSEPLTPASGEAALATSDPPALLDWDHHYDDDAHLDYTDDDDERRTALPWVLATLAVVALLVAGWWFLARDDGSDAARDGGGGDQSAEATQTESAKGDEVAGRATAKAPKTAAPNQDVNGDQVSYDASNMLDGVPETAWRAPGDASGMALTFKLREPTELHQVGLINGYAKTSTDDRGRTFDWYLGNRRVEAVVWVFDDGTKVRQPLTEGREMQTLAIDPVTTSRVVLRLVQVSAPGDGTAARDFTAVSEVSLVGIPQPAV